MSGSRVAILGAGPAGLGAASVLGDQDVVIYDERASWGGHLSSIQVDGFTFDEGPHVSFTRDERIRRLFAESVQGEYRELSAGVLNYFRGTVFKHPGQCHLYPLPAEIKTACLLDFIHARAEPERPIANYRDWCYRSFGRSFSEIFARRYTRKYWTRELEELDTDWIGDRIHAPTLEQVVEGALTESPHNYHYVTTIRYPLRGGFVAFLRALAQGKDIRYGCEAVLVDPRRRTITFASGAVADYEWLISSVPLPELIAAIPASPPAVRDAAARLRCTSHLLVEVGVRGESGQAGVWVYYYDDDVPFSRVSFPSRLSPYNAPDGCFSVQAEIVYGPGRPLAEPERAVEATLDSLIRVGVIRDRGDIVLSQARLVEYANVIFDLDRRRAVATVQEYLSRQNIVTCGRYGEWSYLWSDQAIVSGEGAGRQILEAIAGAPGQAVSR